MNEVIFRQYDNRWRWENYPGGGYYLNGSGCGCVACTHVIIEQDKYKNLTPSDIRPWMVKQGFAVKGQGTRWEGIKKTLEHYGYSVDWIGKYDPITDAWPILKKGNKIGVILFIGTKNSSLKGPDGTVWTTSGHYISFTDYKVENGKHKFYLKDSGGRQHDGWYSYESSMKNCVQQMFICSRVGKQTMPKKIEPSTYKPTTAYKYDIPEKTVKTGNSGKSVKNLQRFLNWVLGIKLSVDGIAGSNTEDAVKVFQKTYGLTTDGVFGPKSRAKAKDIVDSHKPKNTTTTKKETAKPKTFQEKVCDCARKVAKMPKAGYRAFNKKKKNTQECLLCHPETDPKHVYDVYTGNCIWYAFMCWHHGGGIKCNCSCHVIANDIWEKILKASDEEALKIARKYVGVHDIQVIRNHGKALKASMLKPADIAAMFSGNTYLHTFLIMEDGKVADCSRGRKDEISANKNLSSYIGKTKVAIRYIGK